MEEIGGRGMTQDYSAIRADFKGIGYALAFIRDYEAYQECYEVHVFAKNSKTSYDAAMKTIAWGINGGFVVLSVKGEKIKSFTPEPNNFENGLVKRFRFAKDWKGTLTGGNIQ